MIKVLILFIVLINQAIAGVFSDHRPAGFLWYNLPHETKIKSQQPGVDFAQLSYSQRDKVLKYYTLEALHKAHYTHSVQDMRNFLALQNYWMTESSQFSRIFQKALVYYPEYDYAVTHPTSSIGTKLLDEARETQRSQVIAELAKTHGILFFYRGDNPFDSKQIPIIRDFCTRFGLSLIPVSVDGVISPDLANSRLDKGQANRLGMRYFPAVLLVNPNNKQTLPVAYGFTTQDVLEQRLMQVATNFKGVDV